MDKWAFLGVSEAACGILLTGISLGRLILDMLPRGASVGSLGVVEKSECVGTGTPPLWGPISFLFIKGLTTRKAFVFFLSFYGRTLSIWRLSVQSELQLPACTTATATPDPSRVCNLYYSSWQHRILNPLSKARNRTRNLMVPSHFC